MNTAREIVVGDQGNGPVYSVCTLVTKPEQYDEMLASFQNAGFDVHNTEFLFIDNSETNQCDAFEAVNLFLQSAAGRHIILCHQDIRLIDDRAPELERAIRAVESADPNWAVLGNAGGRAVGDLAIRITDPKGTNTSTGPFPARVDSLDENFIIVRRSANLSVSGDLNGFHFYGTDLCIVADVLGYSSWVIDFHLHHLGGASTERGGKSAFHTTYFTLRDALVEKYRRAFRGRWLQNTGTILHLSGSRLKQRVLNSKPAIHVAKFLGKLRKKLRGNRT